MSPSPTTVVSPCSPSIHVHVSRQARAQRTVSAARLGDGDTHRHTLYDFGEVAGRVIRREQCELCSRRSADAGNFPFSHTSAVSIYLELDRLTDADLGELGRSEERRVGKGWRARWSPYQ